MYFADSVTITIYFNTQDDTWVTQTNEGMFVQQEDPVMERKIIFIFYAAHSDCLVQHIFIMKKEKKKKSWSFSTKGF